MLCERTNCCAAAGLLRGLRASNDNLLPLGLLVGLLGLFGLLGLLAEEPADISDRFKQGMLRT